MPSTLAELAAERRMPAGTATRGAAAATATGGEKEKAKNEEGEDHYGEDHYGDSARDSGLGLPASCFLLAMAQELAAGGWRLAAAVAAQS
jgi:hypothetical protein